MPNNTEEFMVLLSEIDPYLNQAIERKDGGLTSNYNLDNYHPRYWLVNGRGFPDSIADNGAGWLPNQPYGALAQVRESDDTTPGHETNLGHPYGGMARYLNVGTETFPFHPHGNNGKVIGRDGNPLETAGGADLSYEKFAIDIGPGQTYDVLFRWYDAEHYSATEPGSRRGSAGRQPGVRDVLQRQSVPRRDRPTAARQPDASTSAASTTSSRTTTPSSRSPRGA